MKVKIHKTNKDGNVRVETSGEIKEVLINENLLYPNNESIALCFRGVNSSGIVELTPKEIDNLYAKVHSRIHLIKGMKILRD